MQELIPLQVGGLKQVSNDFDRRVVETDGQLLDGLTVDTVQVNIGLRCNLACHHCHVESGPNRTEQMSWELMEKVLEAAKECGARIIDITGGAPEMHPQFREFVVAARAIGAGVIVRTNLTILLEDGYRDLPEFFREHRVHLIASLPCYLENNVDKQRGRGVYRGSIEAIQNLNAVGYGIELHLPLDLVFNPGGPSLPPKQDAMEGDYHRELSTRYGIHFSRLITITNMPIGRFLHDLAREGRDQAYMELLRNSFNPGTLHGLMCRHQLHVGHDGTMYDCDFNYALAMPVVPAAGRNIRDFQKRAFVSRRIVTADHCYGCTAGSGSSCTGALD